MNFFYSLISKKQTSVRSAAIILMIMVALSRVLGLVRDRILASHFSPEELGIYFAAFRIPNLLFELLVMGALTSAFIPVFTKYIAEDKEKAAWKMASVLINVCTIILAILCIPLVIWTKEISTLIAPGFDPNQIELMASFTRVMMVSQVFPLLIGNFFTGILQSYQYFFFPAFAPVLYNLCIIAGTIIFVPFVGLWAPVIGIGIGAFAFMAIQIPSLMKVGYRPVFSIDIHEPGVKEVFSLMIPRTMGLAVSQIDTTVDLILASVLGARMVTIFNFAQHLQQVPIGLFGATIAQAVFPLLAQASARNDESEYKKGVISAFNQTIFYVLPISILFIVLRIPIIRLVFGTAKFDWNATVLTGITLSMFSISLIAQAASQVLTRAFYAKYNTKTPVIISVITILINTAISIICIQYYHLPVWALGVSTSIASFINAGALLMCLCQKKYGFTLKEFVGAPAKMLIAAAVMGAALYIPLKLFDQLIFDTTRTFGLIFLTGVSGTIGFFWYAFLVWVFGVSEARSFFKMIDKVRRPKSFFIEPANEVIGNGTQNSPMA